ncbi:TIGR03792 family protein [Tabrizicola sp.]|uniref:TIGR03792 family protein n=1 Tax=Tabrizicola sp. TaxID=2005166 RepID=UPI003F36CA17
MVIEQLTFSVPPTLLDRFLALDHDIWTTALSQQPGFISKEVWREAACPDRIHLIIRWQSRAAWKAVPKALLAETDRRFAEALGTVIPVLLCTDQDVVHSP